MSAKMEAGGPSSNWTVCFTGLKNIVTKEEVRGSRQGCGMPGRGAVALIPADLGPAPPLPHGLGGVQPPTVRSNQRARL
jgi:hypothetical protein